MTQTALRTIVALTLHTIDLDDGYISPLDTGAVNTQTKVHNALKLLAKPDLDEDFFRLADEIIEFFVNLPTSAEYKTIMARADAPAYQTCVDVAKEANVLPVSYPFAVQMPHLYSILKPKVTRSVDVTKLESIVTKAGEYMGQRDVPNKFFVKLVAIGEYDKTKGGNIFQVRDRSGNVGFFYERPDKLKSIVFLGDCFTMAAIPARHAPDASGEKHTIFRSIEILDNMGPANSVIDPKNDSTGLFRRVK